ncbi:TIR-like protein FxsC [Frankia sp. Ag45/Mut15]|uniref:TIR-like protein FxsC n=1 Tax=Frankia umida TaxID=573489 RepID=A0ABT0K1Q2_9ACTN|nr:TIR-like protein FxsC [Frankia umida]MCK9877675.1 TIR-like protein FxsC [Frankia umida]
MAELPLYFFLSYARLDGQDGAHLGRFVDDLRREVRARCGHPDVKEIGFLDTTNIAPGEAWSEGLTEALRRCHTFVAICSPSFFASEYCGKEWQAFSDRCQRGQPNQGTQLPALLPVIWTPLPRLPPVLARLQYDHTGFGELYSRRGLRYLLQLKRNHDDYQEFLVALAERIVHLVQVSPLPPQAEMPDFYRIRSAFEPQEQKTDRPDPIPAEPELTPLEPVAEGEPHSDRSAQPSRHEVDRPQPVNPPLVATTTADDRPQPENGPGAPRPPDTSVPPEPDTLRAAESPVRGSGPKRVTFVMAVASAAELSSLRSQLNYYGSQYDEWTPYHPRSRQRVCIAAQAIAAYQDMSSDIVELRDGISTLLDASRDRNEMVVFIVDAWTTQLEPFHRALREYDNRNEPTTGVLVPWNLDDTETAENAAELRESLGRALRNNIVRQDNLQLEIHTHEEFDASLLQMLVDTQARIFRSSYSVRRSESPPRRRPFLAGP